MRSEIMTVVNASYHEKRLFFGFNDEHSSYKRSARVFQKGARLVNYIQTNALTYKTDISTDEFPI